MIKWIILGFLFWPQLSRFYPWKTFLRIMYVIQLSWVSITLADTSEIWLGHLTLSRISRLFEGIFGDISGFDRKLSILVFIAPQYIMKAVHLRRERGGGFSLPCVLEQVRKPFYSWGYLDPPVRIGLISKLFKPIVIYPIVLFKKLK